jgi:hypothetical protein
MNKFYRYVTKNVQFEILVISFNFCKLITCKNVSPSELPWAPFPKTAPFIKNSPFLIKPLISFSFNRAILFLYKYPCRGLNKSVFNWTFCQLLRFRKIQLHKNVSSHLRMKLIAPFQYRRSLVSAIQ